jgi:hypothetical protein
VLAAETPRVARAKLRMVAAAAFGDVVEQAGDVEHVATLEVGHQPRARRILVRMLRFGETAQIADHHQDMLVDGVDVEQVVLHLADDPPERRKVLAQDAEEVHSPQLVQQTLFDAEHLDEAGAIGRIAPEPAVDQLPVTPQRAQRARGHALECAVLLHHEKGVEHGRGAPRKEFLIAHLEQFVDGFELRVEWHRRRERRMEPGVQVLQQDDVHLAHQLGSPVIALHELLAGAPSGLVGQLQLFCQRRLLIEYQAVLAPLQQIVHAHAHGADEALLARYRASLGNGHQAMPGEFDPCLAKAGSAGYPEHGLQVAQAAWTLLDVGFEVVDRVVVLLMPLLLLQRLGREERGKVHLLCKHHPESLGE